jgi:hypothetical protein
MDESGTDVSIRVGMSLPTSCQNASFVAPSKFNASAAIPNPLADEIGVKNPRNAGGERKMAGCQEVSKDRLALIGTVVSDLTGVSEPPMENVFSETYRS